MEGINKPSLSHFSFADLVAMREELGIRGAPVALDYLPEHFQADGTPKYPEGIKSRRTYFEKMGLLQAEIQHRLQQPIHKE